MKQKRVTNRLARYIASNVMDEYEALTAVQQLLTLHHADWKREIDEARPIYEKKQRRIVKSANDRAEQQNKLHTLTPNEWLDTLRVFKKQCAYCKQEFSYEHLEHFFPLSDPKSPGTTAYNCIPACRDCNLHKGAKDVDLWLKQYKLGNFDTIGTEAQVIYGYLQKCYEENLRLKDKHYFEHLAHKDLYRVSTP